ncbi:hypothetical protein [Bacteroides stercoris]|jgi:membrane protein|uniref:hypothetical protein n=1 Tax=Bacteroides stercoris TaxID=46506 RepID=UPI00319EA427
MWKISFCILLTFCLTSCHPNRKYSVSKDMLVGIQGPLGVSGRDTLKVGDLLTVRKAIGDRTAFVKNKRTGHTHHVSCDSLFNIDTGHTLRQDLVENEQESLFKKIETVHMTKEKRKEHERKMIISLTALLTALLMGVIICCAGKLTRMKVGIAYILISICSLVANYLLFKYYSIEQNGHGIMAYLFSVGKYGWLKTIFFWIIFFILSAANLLGYRATLLLSEIWSGRSLYTTHIFLALGVWCVVYLFSSNEFNDEFLWVLLGIMFVHMVVLIIQNIRSYASWIEMCYIYFYFWACLLPVFMMTLSSLILIPIALFFLVFVRSIPSMVAAGFSTNSSERAPEKQFNSNSKEKACAFCRFYEMSSGQCRMTVSNKSRYGSDAYSCPYYS